MVRVLLLLQGPSGSEAAPVKPLDQEPLLAARIMVEDCLNLMLDVDDIDRWVQAAQAGAKWVWTVQTLTVG